ncbi:orotate phosphoribosyltransferase [Candidatus Woesebacteria bacterium]|nr:orotate phosphoribosyltransferase [Candidatus Woesebacteria bacterium]
MSSGQKDLITILKEVGALMTDDHFIYTSGKHGSVYINKDALYPHTEYASFVGQEMARHFEDQEIDTVVGPALGGIILSQWTAYHLSQFKGKKVYGVYTEKDAEKNQIFTRGYDVFVRNKKVLVVEDLTTTGGSVQKVINSVRVAKGKVVGVCVMVNRNPKEVNAAGLGVPLFVPLAEYPAEAWEATDCPLCKEHVPINTQVGHGRKSSS